MKLPGLSTGARIRAVTFDIGGTLIQPWPSVGHVYSEVAARHGVQVSAEFLNQRFRTAWSRRKQFNDSRSGWEELVDEVFDGLSASPPRTTFFAELYEYFAQPEAWRVFEDVFPAIRALAATGVRLGVISNWDDRLRGLLRRLSLYDPFETIVISCEAGCAKPAAEIFRQAARSLQLPPASILHIGDSLAMDVRGAESAGFHALHLCRDTLPGHPESLTTLTEILPRIADSSAKTD